MSKHKKIMQAEVEMANQSIARNVAEALNAHYPGHAWAVNADVRQGVVVIYNLLLSGEMGFLLHMKDLENDPSMKLVINAGGEFLERYNLRRGGLVQRELDNKEKDFKGEYLHD